MDKRCPICMCTDFTPREMGLWACNQCSIVFSPSIWQPQANEILEDEWFGENYRPVTSSWVRTFESLNNRRTLARLSRAKAPGNRLLEVGVGSGSFLQAAQNNGLNVVGCDLSKAIVSRVNQEFGIEMQCASLSDIPGEGRFDIIVMNHVLEHVSDPVGFLRDAFRLLSPGGIIHLSVPNQASWEAKLPGWTSYEPYHLLYFNPIALRHVVTEASFSIEKEMTYEPFAGWFLAVLRTLLGINRNGQILDSSNSKYRSKNTHRPSLIEHAYRVAMVLSGIGLWPLRYLQARYGHGEEAICIARKDKNS